MSSKRKIRRKECGEKIKHLTLGSALIHLQVLKARYNDSGMRAYGCRVCGGWHIGHKPTTIHAYNPGADKPAENNNNKGLNP